MPPLALLFLPKGTGFTNQPQKPRFLLCFWRICYTSATMRRYTDEHAKAGIKVKLPEIETWPNQFKGYTITTTIPEFTSVCPKTGLPDFGALTLEYEPNKRCLELKSLKEYLLSYRNLGIFYENVVNRVLEDVVNACKPVWAVVHGEFRPRGGISMVVEACYPKRRGDSGLRKKL